MEDLKRFREPEPVRNDDDCCDQTAPMAMECCQRMSVPDVLRNQASDLEKRACCLRELADALPGKLPPNADSVLFSMIISAKHDRF